MGNNCGQNNGKYPSSFSILFYNILKSLLDHTRPFLPDPSSSGRPLCMYFQYHMAEATLSIFPFLLRVFILHLRCVYYCVHPHPYTEEMPHQKLQTQTTSIPFPFKRLSHSLPKLRFFSFIFCQKWNNGKAEVYRIALLQGFMSGLGLECVSNWASPLWNTWSCHKSVRDP